MNCRMKGKLVGVAMALGGAMVLIAGGFALEIGKASANGEAQSKNAVLVVRG
ncbi:MAG: hypothetical protein JOY62_17570 [Acidobacteriaceae bacterium]|nr:hypothetical protein [Acidobacteriaceae bacterium]MBV9781776.1 hypothetical protein [Acidobacteriaceae bacterium]